MQSVGLQRPEEPVAIDKPFGTQATQACWNVHFQTQRSKGNRKATQQEAEKQISINGYSQSFF